MIIVGGGVIKHHTANANLMVNIIVDPFPNKINRFCLFVCIVALRPKSTAMVIAGRSVHLSTLFPGQA